MDLSQVARILSPLSEAEQAAALGQVFILLLIMC